ncbi:MAG: NAD(P)H-dependent oxidoreductase [Pyrinomonadaceae bacterium]
METITNEELVRQMSWRHSVKRFDPNKKILVEDIEALESALLLSPSSMGLQPWRFYVVEDIETRERLRAGGWNQPQFTESSHVIVFAGKTDVTEKYIDAYIERVIEVRGTAKEELIGLEASIKGAILQASENGIVKDWAARQCYIALGTLITAAALRGIDTCPMEGFVHEEFNRILNLDEDGYSAVVACALGYRDEVHDWIADLAKVRFEKDKIIKRI